MDLSTTYMGISLQNPLVASSSPLTAELDSLKRLEDAGAAAVVLPSLFEEQVRQEADELDFYLHHGTEQFAESLSFFPEITEYRLGADRYIDYVAKAHEALDIPVIASLNGISLAGWSSYAHEARQAGADAVEINVYFLPTRPDLDSGAVEKVYLDALAAVKEAAQVPVAMKLSPYFSCLPSLARQLEKSGADALVLFNRFYQPDIDPAGLEVQATLDLSRPSDNRLPQRWIAILYGEVHTSLAASTGIHSGADAARMILAGADVAMLCSVLLMRGEEHLGVIRDEFVEIMEAHGYESLSRMKGVMSQQNCSEPSVYERANYIKALSSYGVV